MFKKKNVSLCLAVLLFLHSSLAFSSITPPSDIISKQIQKLENIVLKNEEDLDQYLKLLTTFLSEVNNLLLKEKKSSIESTRNFDLKEYQESLKGLKSLASKKNRSLNKIKFSQKVFIKKYKEPHKKTLWEKTYDFLTSPVGAFLTVTLTVGTAWIFYDHIYNFFNNILGEKKNSSNPNHNNKESHNENDPDHFLEISNLEDKDQFILQEWSVKLIEKSLTENNREILFKGRNKFGYTSLMWTSSYGHLHLVLKILELREADHTFVNSKCSLGRTAFILAAFKGHTKILEAFLNHHTMNPKTFNAQDWNGNTAIIWATYFDNAESLQLLANSKHMLAYGLTLKNNHGKDALTIAVEEQIARSVKYLLASKHMSIRAMKGDPLKKSLAPFFIAMRMGNLEIVKEFYKFLNKKEFLAITETKQDAFMIAAQYGHHDIVRFLGKKYNKDYDYSTFLGKTDMYGRTALSYAAEHGHLRVVQEMIRMPSFNIYPVTLPSKKFQRTPLMYAVLNKRIEVVKELLKYMKIKHLYPQDDKGNTAFMLAVSSGDLELVKTFLNDHYMDEKLFNMQSYRDRGKETALMQAIEMVSGRNFSKRMKIVELLINSKFMNEKSLVLQNQKGHTVLHLLASLKLPKIIEKMFQKFGYHQDFLKVTRSNETLPMFLIDINEQHKKSVSTKIILKLLENNKAYNETLYTKYPNGENLLFKAIKYGNLEIISYIMDILNKYSTTKEKNYFANIDNRGHTLLMHTAMVNPHNSSSLLTNPNHFVEIASMIIASNFMTYKLFNKQDSLGYSALLWAVENNNNKMIRLLLSSKYMDLAGLNLKSLEGYYGAKERAVQRGFTIMATLIETCELFLMKLQNQGWNKALVEEAISFYQNEEILLLNKKDSRGLTALMWAKSSWHLKIANKISEVMAGL